AKLCESLPSVECHHCERSHVLLQSAAAHANHSAPSLDPHSAKPLLAACESSMRLVLLSSACPHRVCRTSETSPLLFPLLALTRRHSCNVAGLLPKRSRTSTHRAEHRRE